jgi:ribosome-associated protein
LRRKRQRGHKKQGGRKRGKSKVHAYLYSTITTEGEFLPKTHISKTPGTSTEEHAEPGWLIAVRAAEDKKATDIKVLDLAGITSFTDHFLICTGANTRQTQAITDEIGLRMKKQLGELPHGVEGYEQGEWVLSDFGDFLVHVFTAKAREYYSLDRLWREAKEVPIPAE